MTDTVLYRQLHRMLSDPGAASVIKTMTSRHLTWEEFRGFPLSGDLSAEAAWDLFHTLRRASGIEVPIPDLEGNEYWYQRTYEIEDAVGRIQCLCRNDSDLYRNLTMTQNRSVLVKSRIDETVAAAALDGLDVAASDVESLLQLDRIPRDDTERLVRNTLTVLDDLHALIDVPFSAELFMHLRYLLLEGVHVEGIRVVQPRHGLITAEYDSADVSRFARTQLTYMTDYLNHASGDNYDHPVLRALLLPDLFRFYRPLPDSNSEVGRLAFRLYCLKVGLPVLGMLPLSRAKLHWEEGVLDSSTISLQPEPYADARSRDGTDLTGYYTLSVQLALLALRDLNWDLHQLHQRDEELRALLQADPEINHRQRTILGRALRDPNAEFRIAYHKNTHNIVYATARADLLQLADKGFLELGKAGRAMVFKPRPGLREFIEQSYGDAEAPRGV